MRGFVERLNKKLTVPVARLIKDIGWITPNRITFISFLVSGIVAPLIVIQGHLMLAGLIVYVGALLDSLDGDLARERGISSKEGAILDAVLDRYTDLFLIGSLIIYDRDCLLPGLFAMVGSSLVPYIRARTEAEGKRSTPTVGSRDVRNLILFVGLILGVPCATLYTLAIVSNVSALHRLIHALRS